MRWSGSKPYQGMWYRIREDGDGRRELLEARQQWDLEKGQGDDFSHTFNHYFKVDGFWYVQRDVAYRFLYAEIPTRLEHGYSSVPLPLNDEMDERFQKLRPIQEWVLYLEERINDCELAIQYELDTIRELQARLRGRREAGEAGPGQEQQDKARIAHCVEGLCRLKAEHAGMVAELDAEEGVVWHGMARCAELLKLDDEAMLAKFLGEVE